jgi:4'-phosphopantetheinyl transferase
VDLEADSAAPQRSASLEIFTPRERAEAENLDDAALRSVFLIAWTRKEACLKAIGSGFTTEPREIDVGLTAAPRAVRLAPSRTIPVSVEAPPVHVITLPPHDVRRRLPAGGQGSRTSP